MIICVVYSFYLPFPGTLPCATQFLNYVSRTDKLKSTIKKGDRSVYVNIACRSFKITSHRKLESWVHLIETYRFVKSSVRDIIPYHLLEHSLSCKYSLYPVLENETEKKLVSSCFQQLLPKNHHFYSEVLCTLNFLSTAEGPVFCCWTGWEY